MEIDAFFKLSYGMYIVSSSGKGRFNGQIANAVMQVTAEPKQIAVAINKNNLTHEYITESRKFVVSILDEDTAMQLIGRFGFKTGREIDKFKDLECKTGVTGIPIVASNCVAYMECELENSLDVGTHTIFVGRVIDSALLGQGEPMTYDYYHKVKNGRASKNAPTYTETRKAGAEEKKMEKYTCTVCGYVYDPEAGDPDAGIQPGTSFEDLPEDWVCPVCGAGKDDFEKS